MLDVVDSLVRKSPANVERTATGPRFTMLETIRQFAEERLAESAESENVRRSPCVILRRSSRSRARTVPQSSRGPGVPVRRRRDCQRASRVLRWAVDQGRTDAAIRIAACVHQAAACGCGPRRSDGPPRLLTWPGASSIPSCHCCSRWRPTAWGLGLLDEAKRFGYEALTLAMTPIRAARVGVFRSGTIAMFEGDVATSLELLRTGAAHPVDRRDWPTSPT